MSRLSNTRPNSRKAMAMIRQIASQQQPVEIDTEKVLEIIGDTTVVQIPLTIDAVNPMVRHAAQPFRRGTEGVYVNGVRLAADDYTVLGTGNGTGIMIDDIDEHDEVTLTADVVEQQ